MRKLLFSLLLWLVAPAAFAQFTNVTATVRDPSGIAYASCTWNIDFTNNTGISQLPLLSGSAFQQSYSGQCDSSANMSVRLPSSSAITPPGTTWRVTVCNKGGSPCFALVLPACPNASCITGSTIDISAQLQAVAANIIITPPTIGAQQFSFAQSLPGATTWVINHNMGVTDTIVQVRDLNGNVVVPDTNTATNINTVTLTFLQPQAGRAYVLNTGQWTPTAANPNFLVSNPTGSQAVNGDFPLNLGGSLSAKRILGCSTVYGGGPFANIQAAVTDAGTTTGCVIILSSYTGVDTYTNPNDINIIDLRGGNYLYTHTGLFDNSKYNQYHRIQVNGCSTSGLYSSINGGNATNGLAACVEVPVGATQRQSDAIVGMVNNGAGAASPAVGVTGMARATAANSRIFGGNFLATDNSLADNAVNGIETDISLNNASSAGVGNAVVGFFTAQVLNTPAFQAAVGTGLGTFFWPAGFQCNEGTTTIPTASTGCVLIYPVHSGAGQQSQGITFIANNAGSHDTAANIALGTNGNVQFANSVGGAGVQSAAYLPYTAGAIDIGSALLPFSGIRIGNAATNNIRITGTATTPQTQTLQNATGTLTLTIGTGNVTTAGTAIAAGTTQAQTGITVTGALTSDSCTANIPASLPATWQTGIQFRCDVTSANTVTVNLMNPTAGSITPAAQQVNVRVTR